MAQWYRIPLPMQEVQELKIQALGQEDPLEEEMAASSRILAWKIQWTGSLVDYGLWCRKETDMTEQQSTQTTQILAEGHNFFPQKFLLIKIVYEYQKTYQHANIHN